MAEWRKRATLISGDVVYFEYVSSQATRTEDVVYIWDIDKTYLDTQFDSVRSLIRTAMEKAFQKKNIPGTGSLVRALTTVRGPEERLFPIFFISASPPQMEDRIHTKLELDGINPYGAFFKDNLKNLRPKLWWKLNKQVGYKLQALLELRTRLKPNVQQILWGDDSESDAVIYALYSDICARRVQPDQLRYLLSKLFVTNAQTEQILELMERVPINDPVQKIYINLVNDTDPDYYAKFGRRCLATFNTFQVALDLNQDGRLTDQQVVRVAQDMMMNYGYTPEMLSSSMDDIILRGVLKQDHAEALVSFCAKAHLFPTRYHPTSVDPARISLSRYSDISWVPEAIDYLNDFR